MISVFTCSKCAASFAVNDEEPSRSLLKKVMRCPIEGCVGRLRVTAKTNMKLGFEATKISAVELYQATLGAGLPKEKKCSPAAMKKLLVGAKITSLRIEESAAADRSLLFSLTLDRGKVVHLATSARGATIYKVTDHGTGNHH